MRHPVALAAVSLAVACTGCFSLSVSPGAEANWQEPGLWAWLEGNGTAAGFGPGPPEPGLPGARVHAALPPGVEVDELHYWSTERGVTKSFSVAWGNTSLGWFAEGLWFRSKDPPSTQEAQGVLRAALDAIYRGPDEARAAAEAQVLAEWPDQERGRGGSVVLDLDGPWDADGAFPDGSAFTPIPMYTIRGKEIPGPSADYESRDGGDWSLFARGTKWGYSWPGPDPGIPGLMDVTALDGVYVVLSGCEWSPQDVKDLVRVTFPGYPWSFEGFHYEDDCFG